MWSLQIEKKKGFFLLCFPKNLKLILQCLMYASTSFISFLILESRESASHVIKKKKKKQAVKKRLSKVKFFCINLHNVWAPGYLFLFLLQHIHSSLTEVVLPLASISIYYTVSLCAEVTPVIYTHGP